MTERGWKSSWPGMSARRSDRWTVFYIRWNASRATAVDSVGISGVSQLGGIVEMREVKTMRNPDIYGRLFVMRHLMQPGPFGILAFRPSSDVSSTPAQGATILPGGRLLDSNFDEPVVRKPRDSDRAPTVSLPYRSVRASQFALLQRPISSFRYRRLVSRFASKIS